ncbi:MAG TPA: 5-deoxy-glucuronate isomerase [Gaiellaceae bacterium]|nr:5-deoxy-glucuronate isomerase [Gaiellaceae bacterium]
MRGAELHLPTGTATDGGDPVVVTPESAGWELCGLRVIRLSAGESRVLDTDRDEVALLPLSGSSVVVEVDGQRLELEGRRSVFARVTDWAYVPMDAQARLTSAAGCELAVASARATRRLEPVAVAAEDVAVETRGSGNATRQVVNFLTPDAFEGADKLICCELFTPDGNWSSYPPHKHDDTEGSPVWNEEIYYFRIGRAGSVDYAPQGYGIHRTYTHDGSIDATVTVRDGDVFLVPRGYHGPCAAASGYPMYYLNVMAGPEPGRRMEFVDDPSQAWIRETWATQELDPRVPLTTAEGPA